MAFTTISAFGTRLFTTAGLQQQQATLADLTEQLATTHKHNNLTDYTPLEAQNIISLQNQMTQRQAYIASMKTVQARLDVYDGTMTDMENIAAQAAQLANQNPTQDTSKTGILQQEVLSFMKQAVADLNQKVGSRYIYAGTRYSTVPVDLDTVTDPGVTPSATLVTANTLPAYDTGAPGTSAAAWTQDSATIDDGNSLTYGVTSTQTGFQQLIAGMQFMNAATQPGVSAATYQSYMSQASTLLSQATTNIQTYHAGVAASINTVTQELDQQNTDVTSLQQQLGDIQNVDLTEVGTALTLLQSQLQAAYSATAAITQQTLLKYL